MNRPAAMAARAAAIFLRGYQLVISPIYGPVCRYAPSCSHYAHEAVLTHGVLRGSWLALKRLARCHPWGGSGFDPVPPRTHTCAHTYTRAHAHRHTTEAHQG